MTKALPFKIAIRQKRFGIFKFVCHINNSKAKFKCARIVLLILNFIVIKRNYLESIIVTLFLNPNF